MAYNSDGYCPPWKAPDHEVGSSTASTGAVGSVVDLPPHSATLGLRFYDGSMFPAEYHNRAFYAEHGSWDRTLPSGYAVATAAIVGRFSGEGNSTRNLPHNRLPGMFLRETGL